MGSNDQYITAGIILLVAVGIGLAVHTFLPGAVSTFITTTVQNILASFP